MSNTHLTNPKKREMIRQFTKREEYQSYAQEQDMYFDLAFQLLKIRKTKGITQADLAEKMGVKQSTIARLEKTGRLSTRMLARFCKATDTKINFSFA